MARPLFITLAALALAVAAVAVFLRDPADRTAPQQPEPRVQVPPRELVPDAAKYATLIADLEAIRHDLARRHAAARDADERRLILGEARTLLELVLPEMMRCWLGTPWDFEGMAERPGNGSIACGYFVSTILRDAGFRIDRIRLAQQPSQLILGAFVPRREMTLRVGVPYDDFCKELRAAEPGIYIVGLDHHVAFLLVNGDGFRMIHASGSAPRCVVDEGPDDATVLRRSRYRVLGNLTQRHDVLEQWLASVPFAARNA